MGEVETQNDFIFQGTVYDEIRGDFTVSIGILTSPCQPSSDIMIRGAWPYTLERLNISDEAYSGVCLPKSQNYHLLPSSLKDGGETKCPIDTQLATTRDFRLCSLAPIVCSLCWAKEFYLSIKTREQFIFPMTHY